MRAVAAVAVSLQGVTGLDKELIAGLEITGLVTVVVLCASQWEDVRVRDGSAL
jgi:hypothetical protein